ncbi:A disintegrin and metalloproteinase with thrombospondin motifs 9 [Branchiostoma belcheri]|nr:A disintegrin and metalloproteinase with thrombospondin motifs 9 [Branchiostoma belcheri]
MDRELVYMASHYLYLPRKLKFFYKLKFSHMMLNQCPIPLQCSVTCGRGLKTREVVCKDSAGVTLPHHHCPKKQPRRQRKCRAGRCPKWRPDPWSTVSPSHLDQVFATSVTYLAFFPPTADKQDLQVVCELSAGGPIREETVTSVLTSHSFSPDSSILSCCPPHSSNGSAEQSPPSQAPTMKAEKHSRLGPHIHGIPPKCSVTCGKGTMRREVHCRLGRKGKPIEEERCQGMKKPRLQRSCQVKDCPTVYTWKVGRWQKGYTHSWDVPITLGKPRNSPEEILHSINIVLIGEKPLTQCTAIRDCHGNRTSPWKRCPISWEGRKANVLDKAAKSTQEEPVAQSKLESCAGERASTTKTNIGHRWCTATCGVGMRQRTVTCTDPLANPVDDSYCDADTRPETSVDCNERSCVVRWTPGDWSESLHLCSSSSEDIALPCRCMDPEPSHLWVKLWAGVQGCLILSHVTKQSHAPVQTAEVHPCLVTQCDKPCGPGFEHRSVTCQEISPTRWSVPQPAYKCSGPKPSTMRSCNLGDCRSFTRWRTGPWSECSVTCGGGLAKRSVQCVSLTGTTKPSRECSRKPALRPDSQKPCNKGPCLPNSCSEVQKLERARYDGEFYLHVHGKILKVYCRDMETSRPSEYITLAGGEGRNYAEIYQKSLFNPNQCPHNGSRNASCQCHDKGHPDAGYTAYDKVRISLDTMQISVSDMQFARTVHGKAVPFGNAGDCYSTARCPQLKSWKLLATDQLVLIETLPALFLNLDCSHIDSSSRPHREEQQARVAMKPSTVFPVPTCRTSSFSSQVCSKKRFGGGRLESSFPKALHDLAYLLRVAEACARYGFQQVASPSTSEAGRNPRRVGQQQDQPGQGRVQQVLPAEGQVQPPAPSRRHTIPEQQPAGRAGPTTKASQRRSAAEKFSSSVGAWTASNGRRPAQAPARFAASSHR